MDGGSAIDSGAIDGSPEASCPGRVTSDLGSKSPISVAGDPPAALGVGDPSILYPVGATAGFMSYSAVTIGAANTRLATSTDHGASWAYVGDVNAVTPVVITTSDNSVCGAPSCNGKWIHEVSSLIDDPTDPAPSRRFKIFTHTYFSTSTNDLRREIGSISMWTASSLQAGPLWSETRLLGWTSSSPQTSSGVRAVVSTDAALGPLLGKCVALTEPAAFVRGGTIDLAVGCIRFVSSTSVPIEIFLVRSIDHGQTWSPVGKLLDEADAVAIGATGPLGPQINAPEIALIGARYYLFATPNGPVSSLGTSTADGYRGCYLYPFADIEKGQLERCEGRAVVVRSLVGPPGLFHGACTYAAGADAAGIVYLSADVGRTPPFRIFPTGILVP